MDSAVRSSKWESNMNQQFQDETNSNSEKWIAWLDGKRDDAVEFDVPLDGTFDVAEAGAFALGIDVCEELNVARAR